MKPEPEPSDRSAAITQITVEPGATVRSYVTQIGQLKFLTEHYRRSLRTTTTGLTPAQAQVDVALDQVLRAQCISVYAQVRMTGFEDVRKRLTFNLYDAARGLPVPGFSYLPPTAPTPDQVRAGFVAFRAAQGLEFESRSESDQYVGRTCIGGDYDSPPPSSRYFVRVELGDDDGRLLTYRDSDPFVFRRSS